MCVAEPNSRHLAWIEAGRTVAMVVVVWTHASNMVFFREGDFSLLPLFSSTLVCFAVPAFFIISGYLAGNYEAHRPAGIPFFRRPVRQMAKLAPAFLAWNTISLLVLNRFYSVPLWTLHSLLDLLTGTMQLYFIFAMLQILGLLCLTNPFATPRRLNAWALMAGISTLAFYTVSNVLFHTVPPHDYIFELTALKVFPVWGGFYFLGAWLSRHDDLLVRLMGCLPLLLAASVLFFLIFLTQVVTQAATLGANYRQYFLISGLLFQTTAALALLCACRLAEKNNAGRIFATLVSTGRDTLGIYLSHYTIVLVFYAAIPLPVRPGLRLPLGLVAMLAAFGGGLWATRLARQAAPSRLARLLFAA